MNEKLLNFNTKVESQDKKERQEKLFKKIEEISFVYANEEYKKEKEKNSEYKFSKAVKNFTPIENIIIQLTNRLEGFNFSENKEKIDLFFEKLYQEIDNIYNPDIENIESILDLVDKKRGEFIKYLNAESLKEIDFGKKDKETKIFSFNKINNIEFDQEGRYKNLLNKNFSAFGKLIEVHIDDFYSSGNNALGFELIKSDLSKIAERIIDFTPEVSAVVGRSWLLDSPLSKKIGFQVLENDEDFPPNDFSTWLQFIDKDGNISQKRLEDFIKNKKIPYKSIVAYIPVEDFLKRYLPEDRRGKIALKKINKERLILYEKIKTDSSKIKVNWNELIEKEIDFGIFFEEATALKFLLDFLDGKDKKKYLDFLKNMFSHKIEWENFNKYKDEEIEKIDKKIEKLVSDDLFEDYEVLID